MRSLVAIIIACVVVGGCIFSSDSSSPQSPAVTIDTYKTTKPWLFTKAKERINLQNKKAVILGMAFKADIDDIRDSLSFKLGKILRFHGAKVYYSDEFAKNPDFVSKEELVNQSDVIIVAVPHSAYNSLKIPKGKEVVDLWKVVKKE